MDKRLDYVFDITLIDKTILHFTKPFDNVYPVGEAAHIVKNGVWVGGTIYSPSAIFSVRFRECSGKKIGEG